MEFIEAVAALALSERMAEIGYMIGWYLGGLSPLSRKKKGATR